MKTKDKILDGIVSFICIIFPLTTIPQVKKIWMEQNVEGISLLTWVLYLVFTIPLIAYAIKKKGYEASYNVGHLGVCIHSCHHWDRFLSIATL
ncbi:PQ-loop repeat-containing protein [bacterium]|jgi:uncharacterized protein with PQ loop repeat|nr:PQ-loop repeat-containing protein [bacterium]MBT5015583.1 PQ-loop repeat-containing protein [bacterium]